MIFVLLKVLTCLVCAVPISLKGGISKAEEYTNGAVKNKIDKSFIKANNYDWRVYTDSTARRDSGLENCWDVNEIAFFSDILCSSSNSIAIASNARISSGTADNRFKLDNAFDGSEVASRWGGRSTDGDFGSSEVWIGVLGIANLKCIKLTQGDSKGGCRPSSEMLIQKRTPGTTNWITEKKIAWSAAYDGTHKFNIEDLKIDWRLYTDSTVRRDDGLENCWDVNEIAFFSDILCSNSIEIDSSARISSGSASDAFKLDNAFDGVLDGKRWGGRSTDGNFGSKEVWIGVLGIANLNCIKLTQADDSTSNICRPSSKILIEKRIPGTTDWITEKEITWSTPLEGTHEFKIKDLKVDWRVYTDSTVRRDQGLENCWDVNEIAFFSDILCSNPIEIAHSARISSGSAGDRWKLDFAFDGVVDGSRWGGRSKDGNFGSKEVWIGVLGIANLKCIKLSQGPSSNICRPSSKMLIQKREPGTTNWITEKEITMSTANNQNQYYKLDYSNNFFYADS